APPQTSDCVWYHRQDQPRMRQGNGQAITKQLKVGKVVRRVNHPDWDQDDGGTLPDKPHENFDIEIHAPPKTMIFLYLGHAPEWIDPKSAHRIHRTSGQRFYSHPEMSNRAADTARPWDRGI